MLKILCQKYYKWPEGRYFAARASRSISTASAMILS
jgi:hypothetical protein